MQVEIGQLLDSKYRIVRMLGEGGMGTVYEGQNVRIGHRVAIKVLHAELASRSDVIERFEREAQAAGRIGSEHIVDVYDLGELPGGTRYMVMEYLDGENLAARILRDGRMHPQAIAPIFLHVLEALAAAHAAGIVHRDLKPENIFLVRDKKTGKDFAKLVDFGVSKFNYATTHSGNMTRTGSVIGTPFYMSPEQAKGLKQTDHRSDLYSLGVVLFECATGRVPFHAETFNELMFKIVLEEPPDPAAVVPDMDPYFASIVRKAMARTPEARYQDAPSFQSDISEWIRSVGLGMASSPPLLSSLTPNTSKGPAAGPLGETALSAPGGPTPLPGVSAQSSPGALGGPSTLLSNTGGSLPGASSTAVPTSPKSTGALVTAVAVTLALAAGAVLVAFKKSAPVHETAAVTVPSVQAAAAPPAAPAATAALAAPPSIDPPLAAAPAAPPEAGPTDSRASARPHVPSLGSRPASVPPKPAATPPPAAPANATAEQLKGRTIRTDL